MLSDDLVTQTILSLKAGSEVLNLPMLRLVHHKRECDK